MTAISVCALSAAYAEAATLKLEWDASSDSSTAGYVVVYGRAGQGYGTRIDVGSVNSFQVLGLTEGAAYCFVVQSYNTHGMLSDTSNEVCGTPTMPERRTVLVKAGENLQAAINAAQSGDTLLLQAGATFVGNFVLPARSPSSTTFITLRSSAPDESLPAPGERMTPEYAPQLPKLRSPNGKPALATAAGAHHYRVELLEFGASAKASGTIVMLGDGTRAQDSLDDVPSDLVIDRVYVHGDAERGQARGIALNSAATEVTNSFISDIKSTAASQAIAGWNGPGPYLIANNYLQAAGQNVQIGSTQPSIPQLVPSDITIRDNHFSKVTVWKSQPWGIASLLDFRSARRVGIHGNLFEQFWTADDSGFAIRFAAAGASTTPWSFIQSIEFRDNIVRDVAAGLFISRPTDDPEQVRGMIVANNLFDRVSAAAFGGSGVFLRVGGASDLVIDHNTIFNDGTSVVLADKKPSPRLQFTNNLLVDRGAAIAGGRKNPGLPTIAVSFPYGSFLGNIMVGANPLEYPVSNYYPLTLGEVGMVWPAGGNYRLGPDSIYRDGGTDGLDPGYLGVPPPSVPF